MRIPIGEHTLDCTDRPAIMAILNVGTDSPVAHFIGLDPNTAFCLGNDVRKEEAVEAGRGHRTADHQLGR
ncbi:MAG: hypothetical protein O6913_00940 [Chloroflexi bacterium]|nr:hypothetical protein [Chloroflexota bacterium]